MAWVTQEFLDTWRSGEHVGAARPVQVVEVRRAEYTHGYNDWPGPAVDATIPGETSSQPWWPIFTPIGPWVEVPNDASVELTNSFDQNGLKVATIQIDNVGYVRQSGPMGQLYHLIEQGYFAPNRGNDPPTRPASGLARNEWANVLTESAQLRVWQGYGLPRRNLDGSMPLDGGPNGAWVFNGLVDDVDLDSSPTLITVTARMGKIITDARVFGYNKSKSLKDPVTFADRKEANDIYPEGYGAKASSSESSSFLAANVVDKDSDAAPTYWESAGHSIQDFTEWVQVYVPQGRYSSIVMECDGDLDCYIGVYPKPLKNGSNPTVDGQEITSIEFYDDLKGEVPGDNGGWRFVNNFTTTDGEHTHTLDHEFVMGKGSIIRVGFRTLQNADGAFRARVRTLHGQRQEISSEAKSGHWILVDDVSDVVRVALRWAGYSEWEIEDTGTRLPGKLIINRSQFLVDIIKTVKDATGFVFFVTDPLDGESLGIPTFRRSATLLRELEALAAEVRDTDLLTALQVKTTEEPLAYIIRVRGKTAAKLDGGRELGGDTVRRVMYVYRPPWSHTSWNNNSDALAGIIKHETKTYDKLRTSEECEVGALLIACEEALAAATAGGTTPGNPNVELDDQIGLLDEGTGTNQRLWVSKVSSTFQTGENTSWTSTLEGALIDNPFLVAVIEDIIDLAQEYDAVVPMPVQLTGTRARRIR